MMSNHTDDGAVTDDEFLPAMLTSILDAVSLVAWVEELNIEMDERPKLEKVITDTVKLALLKTIADYRLR